MRALIDVHLGAAHDLENIAQLCLMAREESATPAQVCTPDTERLKTQLGVLLAIDGGNIYVATHDGRTVGFLLSRLLVANVYNDDPVMYVEAVYVDQSFRRQGVGHALLSALARAAAEAGVVEVISVPIPGSRGVQRFLARMGFAPAAAHRVVSTSVLLRRLEAEGPTRRTARGLEDLIARRRKARIETQSGPVDLRGFHAGLIDGGPAGGGRVDRGPGVEGRTTRADGVDTPRERGVYEVGSPRDFPGL